jgi:hypothetical protein
VASSPYTISATLSPAGVLCNYTITYNTASLTINKATASVTPAPASKTYGTTDPTLTGTPSGFLATDGVTATYSRTAGETVAGSPYTISATLSPAGVLGNYAITYNTAGFTITPATPTVTWANPADIIYPTALGGAQLNATANVAGTFAYTPAAGTVLQTGNGQLLSVLFTPADNGDYTTTSAQVRINVLPLTIQQLIAIVDGLVTSGVLTSSEGPALTAKLNAAAQSIDRGNTNAAKGELGAFINQMNALINSHRVTQAQGQSLINLANILIAGFGA